MMSNRSLLEKELETQMQSLCCEGNLRELKPGNIHNSMHDLSSNDYLGISQREELREEFMGTFDYKGNPFSASSSRLITGNHPLYSGLEEILTNLYGRDAIAYNSGYHANIGILPAITGRQSLIVADKLVHASIIDGIRLSGAQYIRYPHNDYDRLEKIIAKNHNLFSTIIVVTEGLFSMDGDICDIGRLLSLKRRYNNIVLYIDEAHSFGVRGERGLGVIEEYISVRGKGSFKEIDIIAGTLGKSAASSGAFAVVGETLKRWLINRSRSLIFTTAAPPISIAWSTFIVKKMVEMHAERSSLASKSKEIRELLERCGFEHPSCSHIIPAITGSSQSATKLSQILRDNGIYALPMRPPTVPEGSARVRLSVNASLSSKALEDIRVALVEFNTLKLSDIQ